MTSIIYNLDKNECLTGNGGCSHLCHNHPGSFSCSCYGGYNLIDQFVCRGTLNAIIFKSQTMFLLSCNN